MNKELEHILQVDRRSHFTKGEYNKPMIDIYNSPDITSEDMFIYCALIPNSIINECMNTDEWELNIGTSRPGCNRARLDNGEINITYHRFGRTDEIEPLIINRDFHGIKDETTELVEEFRLFHNLYFDKQSDKMYKINDSGGSDLCAIINNANAQVSRKYLRQFLAIKDMALMLYFSSNRYSALSIDQIPEERKSEVYNSSNLIYSFHVQEYIGTSIEKTRSISTLTGKCFIKGSTKSKSGIWPYNDKKRVNYQRFIINVDDDDEPIYYTCNPKKLANYFGANPGAPYYVTPVYFKIEVLSKYYSDPSVFSVEDNLLKCGSLWMLRMDNQSNEYIIVFLGDLGQSLPEEERGHWLLYNIPPQGPISEVSFRRNFLGEFTDTERADLKFKNEFQSLQTNWLHQFGWNLFKPLPKDDSYILTAIRIPISDNQDEFDQQILYLSKLIIDSINEARIKQLIGGSIPKKSKGIAKLNIYLNSLGYGETSDLIEYLRKIQMLRSKSSAHRKSSSLIKEASKQNIDLKSGKNQKLFEKFLLEACGHFLKLKHFLILMKNKIK